MPQQIEVPGMGILEFPDGMSDADMAAAIQKNMPQKPSVAADVGKSAVSGVGSGLVGLAGLPGDLSELGARGLDRATRFVGKQFGYDIPERADQAPKYGSADIKKGVEGYTGEFYKPQTTAGEYAHTVGEFTPGMIGGGGVAGLARRAVTNVVAPALGSEAAGQATKGTAYEPYARVAGALAGGIAPTAAGRIVTPLPASNARNALVDTLENEGVTAMTAGQRTGSPTLRYAESVLGDYPGAGGKASRAQSQAQEQFTEAAMRRAGSGPTANAETLAANSERLGNEFEDLSARNHLMFDQQFVNDASRAIRNYDRVPPSQQRSVVENYINDIAQHMQGGNMPGAYYQEMRSRLSRQSFNLKNTDPTLSEALGDLRNSLDNAMRRSMAPADIEAWDRARQQYGAQKTIESAASRAGEATAEGQIMPANLRNAVTAKNRGAYARGEGDFAELARAGSGVMTQMPQSGTAPRALIQTLATGVPAGMVGWATGGEPIAISKAVAAGAVAPALAGRALMSKIVQDYLGNQRLAPILNAMAPKQSALVGALLASEGDRGLIPRGAELRRTPDGLPYYAPVGSP